MTPREWCQLLLILGGLAMTLHLAWLDASWWVMLANAFLTYGIWLALRECFEPIEDEEDERDRHERL